MSSETLSSFDLKARAYFDEVQIRRNAVFVRRQEIQIADEAYLASIEEQIGIAAAKTWEAKNKEDHKRAADEWVNLTNRKYEYKNAITARETGQFCITHEELPGSPGLNQVRVGCFDGNQDYPWQQYRSQRRIPIEELNLQNICGYWADENDWEYIGYRIGDRKPVIDWLPRKEEITRLKLIAEAVHQDQGLPTILEIGCGCGLLSYLLAATGELSVVGMDPDEKLLLDDNQYSSNWGEPKIVVKPYSHPHLTLIPGTSKTMVEVFQNCPPDVVISSWMPEKIDFTCDILALSPKAIILVYPDDEMYRERFISRDGYRKTHYWKGPTKDDVIAFSQVANAFSYGDDLDIRGDNVAEVQLRSDVGMLNLPGYIDIPPQDSYKWESRDLQAIMDPNYWNAFHGCPNYTSRIPILEEGLKRLMAVEPIQKYS